MSYFPGYERNVENGKRCYVVSSSGTSRLQYTRHARCSIYKIEPGGDYTNIQRERVERELYMYKCMCIIAEEFSC